MGTSEITNELIDQLLGEHQGPGGLIGPDGLIHQLRKGLIERAAGAELTSHLGYQDGSTAPTGQDNRRNGTTTGSPLDSTAWKNNAGRESRRGGLAPTW